MSSREFDDGEDRVRGSAALQPFHHREVTPPEGSSSSPAPTTPGPLQRRAGEQVARTDYTEAGRDVLRALGIAPETPAPSSAPSPSAGTGPVPLAPVPAPALPDDDTAPAPAAAPPPAPAPEPLRLVTPPATPPEHAAVPAAPAAPGARSDRAPQTGPIPVVRPQRRASRRSRGTRARSPRPLLAAAPPVEQTAEAIGLSVPAAAEQPRSRRAELPARGPTTDVVFSPRSGLRAALGALLLLAAAATVYAGITAYDERSTLAVGIAGTLLGTTLALYGIRAGSSPARLRIHGGQLEVVRGAERDVFDLTSRYTRIEIVGEPGRRGWKVRFARFGRDPLVIDSSMVDPHAFIAELDRHRTPPERR